MLEIDGEPDPDRLMLAGSLGPGACSMRVEGARVSKLREGQRGSWGQRSQSTPPGQARRVRLRRDPVSRDLVFTFSKLKPAAGIFSLWNPGAPEGPDGASLTIRKMDSREA